MEPNATSGPGTKASQPQAGHSGFVAI